ncbi:MAG: hypothetical protein ABJA02_05290 [Acidobacteriota bacterium]
MFEGDTVEILYVGGAYVETVNDDIDEADYVSRQTLDLRVKLSNMSNCTAEP